MSDAPIDVPTPSHAPVGGYGRAALEMLAIGAGAFVLAFISLTLLGDRRLLPVWMPNALALALLLRAPPRAWLKIVGPAAAGSMSANLVIGDPLAVALLLTLVNILEYVGCAAALRWRVAGAFDLTRPALLIRFVAIAGLASPLASAVLARALLGLAGQSQIHAGLTLWTLGDALGLLTLTPAILALGRVRTLLDERPLTPRGMLSLAVLMLACAAVLRQSRYQLMYLLAPALLWVSLELEVLGSVVGVILMGAAAIVFTGQGQGPIAALPGGMARRAIDLQLFLATAVVTSMTAATMRTQRRRLQMAMAAALAESEEQARRARMAEEVAGVGYWRLDAVTRKITWSKQMFAIFGLPPAETPDLEAAMDLVHPDDRGASDARLGEGLRTGLGWQDAVTRIRQPDGEVRYVTGRAICEKDARGRVVAVFGTLADVTDQKVAEAGLADSEGRYRLLAENATDTILYADFEGRITYISPAARALTGFEPEQLIGREWRELVHPEDIALLTRKGERARKSPVTYRPKWIEYRIVRKDGRAVWVQTCPNFVLDPQSGRAVGFTDVVRDNTERKALEAELTRALAEAEAAAAVKTEFLANMSHELRTPITAVLGFSRLLEQEPGLRPQARRYVERVGGASKALLSVVNDILDFSKLEAGQVEINRRPDSPAAPARETIELFAAQASDKGIALGIEGVERLPPLLSIDADRLRQMLLNLVGNAVKFTDSGSVQVQAGYDEANMRLSYAVADTGPGVEPAQLERLFQRFSQVDASTTRKHGGAGLGLAICKGLAEAMGGQIGAECVPGRGSRFWFWVAAEPAQASAQADGPGGAPIMPPGCRILVADDNPANRDLARCLLEPFGAVIHEAVDGRSAVELAQAQPFDVILMDVRMPGLDGPGAMKLIRAGRGPNRTAPILAFSADVGSHGAPDFLAMGFDGQIGKPLTALDLITAVAACLAHEPPAGADPQAMRVPALR